MALQRTAVLDELGGVVIPVYTKVTDCALHSSLLDDEGTKEWQLAITTKDFLNAEKSIGGYAPVRVQVFQHIIESPDVPMMATAYAHLKTLPEFADAVDV